MEFRRVLFRSPARPRRNADRQEIGQIRCERLSQSLCRRDQARDRQKGESQRQARARGCRGTRPGQRRIERHRPDGRLESLGRGQEKNGCERHEEGAREEIASQKGAGQKNRRAKARLMELNDALWWETIDTEVLLRLGVATLVGLLLGLDRELKGYDAGLRTHGMVALSSSLMTVVAIALYQDWKSTSLNS